MSKTTLKKEISNLDKEQIIEVLLTAYSSNKAIKEYFDFFCNPDVDKLYESHLRKIAKELSRGKYRRSTARISRIKRTLRDFESFNPGAEAVRDLRIATVKMLIETYSIREFTKPLTEGTLTILNDTIAFADKHLIVGSTMEAVMPLLNNVLNSNRSFRNFLKNNLQL